MVVLVASGKFESSGPLVLGRACSSSFLLGGVVLWGGPNDLGLRSLAYAPGVSVFPARSGFTPGGCMSMWVVAHTVVAV